MSTSPPPFDPSEDSDEQYRRASELDPSRPSETTRRAVLAHAARLAAERARREARRRWLTLLGDFLLRRPAVTGTVAAAVLAAVVIAPQFLAPGTPRESDFAPAPAPSRAARAPPATPAGQNALETRAPPAAAAEPARSRSQDVALQRVAPPAPVAFPSPSAPAATLQSAQGSPSAARTAVRELAAARSAPAGLPPGSAASDSASGGARSVAAVAAVARATPARRPADPEDLRRAAAAGDLPTLTAGLESGSDIEARDAQGRTALMLATLNGRADAVAVLLAHGADPSAADASGTTPLQAAVAGDERQIIAVLRRYGAR